MSDTTEQKMAKLIERERQKFADYDQKHQEITEELARVRESFRQLVDLMERVDDFGLRLNSCETRLAANREQREKWFELLNNVVEDVLKNRRMIRELSHPPVPKGV